ncbi:purine efflux pump PbuE [Paenibacillus montaniterrae]|uniref:Purine efflux pump PbuE n=1 Tax=Paenibacillus montaniterrae TaxID=429341 RepID=A0A919YWI9_9BACL|nr:MFS transporter [Paenibacillus montaniterrae]GIP18566.1 purine efflux pump PbuE [Paenibacillus montaniterrae]
MNIKVVALTISAFVVGLIELIIGGILPQIAADLQISITKAGLLITVFSLIFALAGPILFIVTSKFERKKIMLAALAVFFVGTLLSFWGASYEMLMLARVINAASGSLIVVLALTLSVKVVPERYMARAIGLVSMGISSSIVIGIPIGVLISDYWNWRIIFLFASVLTIIAFFIIVVGIDRVPAGKAITIRDQLRAIKRIKILSAHGMMMFAIGGHYVFYAYLSPYLTEFYGLGAGEISIIYFIFGFSAIAGGYIGGMLSDKLNPRRAIIAIVTTFLLTLLAISFTRDSFALFVVLLVLWGIMSWAVSPPEQAYLIETDPATADIQQSIHNSALQIGIAAGSGIGGYIIDSTNNVANTTWTAALLMAFALLLALFSITRKNTDKNHQAVS